jgi:hypothetical protein
VGGAVQSESNCAIEKDILGICFFFPRIRTLGLLSTVRSPVVTGILFLIVYADRE